MQYELVTIGLKLFTIVVCYHLEPRHSLLTPIVCGLTIACIVMADVVMAAAIPALDVSFCVGLLMDIVGVTILMQWVLVTEDAAPPRECCVCLTRRREAVLVPCGHYCLCEYCALEWGASNERCPICRAQVDVVVKVFG